MSRAAGPQGLDAAIPARERLSGAARWAVRRPWVLPCMVMVALAWPALFGEKWHSDAPRYTVVTLMMLERGDWWTLSDGYGFFFNKPPLGFWVRGAFVAALGPHNWATRLPDVLAAVGIVWVLVDVVRRLHGRRAALLSGLVLATTPHFVWFLDALKLEYIHILLMLLAVRATVTGVQRGRGWRIALSGVWLGLALLTKPMAALPVLPMMAAWILVGTRRRALALWVLPAAVAAAAVAAPWHVSMVQLHGDLFSDRYFGEEVLKRAAAEHGIELPWWYYFERLWTHYWPWLGVVVAAVVSWAAGWARPRGRAGTALMVIWTCGWLGGMMAFGGKGPHYLVQVYPGLAWVCGAWMARAWPRGAWRVFERFGPPAAAAALAVMLVAAPVVERERSRLPDSLLDLIAWLEAHPEEEVWNEGLKFWTVGLVYIKSGRLLKAEVPPVSQYGQRASWAPVGALAATRVGKDRRTPRGEIVFKSGNIAIYRKAARTPAPEGAP